MVVGDSVVVAAGSLNGDCCVMPAVFVVVVDWLGIDVDGCVGAVLLASTLRTGKSSSLSMSMATTFLSSIRSKLTAAGDLHREHEAPRANAHHVSHLWQWNMPGDGGPDAAAFLSPSCKRQAALLKLRELKI